MLYALDDCIGAFLFGGNELPGLMSSENGKATIQRQDELALQVMALSGLELYVIPYKVIGGMIKCAPNARSRSDIGQDTNCRDILQKSVVDQKFYIITCWLCKLHAIYYK